MLQVFEPKWVEAVWTYCKQHPYETLEITYYLMSLEGNRTLGGKRDGRLYISCDGDSVDGLALFNVKGVMYISFATEAMFKKVDFLKAIHKEQPTLVRGTRHQVERVFYFLQRVLKDFHFYKTELMVFDQPPHGLSEVLSEAQALYRETLDTDLAFSIVPAHRIDWLVHGKFLMEVEQHFRSQTMTINNLRHKIHNRIDFEFYHVLMQQDKVMGQLICEFATEDVAVMGGVYLRPAVRGQGLGKRLCAEGVNRILSLGKQPVLYVSCDNPKAINLYNQLGFKKQADTLDLAIKLNQH